MPRTFLVMLLAAGLVVMSCSDEKKNPVQPEPTPKPMFTVSGELRAWRCRVCDYYNNRGLEILFSVATGRSATFRFIDSSSDFAVSLTDDSSRFSVGLDSGLYTLVIETDYTRPDTVRDVHVGGDTTLTLDIVYNWLRPTNLIVEMYYPDASDSLGEFRERAYLQFLEDRLGGVLVVDSALRAVHVSTIDPEWIYAVVYYDVAIGSGVPKWLAVDSTDAMLQQYTSFFPMSIWSDPGVYMCLMQ